MGSGVFLPTWPCTILALHRPCTPRRGAVAYGTQHDLRDGGRLDRYSIPRVGVRHYTASYAKRTVFARGRGFWRFPRYHSGPRVDHSVVETDNCSGKLTLLSSLTLHSPPSRGPHRLTDTRVPLSAPPSQYESVSFRRGPPALTTPSQRTRLRPPLPSVNTTSQVEVLSTDLARSGYSKCASPFALHQPSVGGLHFALDCL